MLQNNIRSIRLSRGITQAALADQVGVTQQAIAGWERGVSTPNATFIAALARALRVSADELLDTKPTVPNDCHDLMDELFKDSPHILKAIKNVTADGILNDGSGDMVLSTTSKRFIKQTILLALKEARETGRTHVEITLPQEGEVVENKG